LYQKHAEEEDTTIVFKAKLAVYCWSYEIFQTQ